MALWLLKTEPDTYSWDDLARDKKATWDGVANATALKNIRAMSKGDLALIYHTGGQRAAIGIAEIVSAPRPDPKETDERLAVVDLKAKSKLARPVTLDEIKADKTFAGWDLLRIGRLSVVSVPQKMWDRVIELSEIKQVIPMSQNDPQDDRPHAEADDSEQVYFQGSPMLRYELARQWPVALLGFAIMLAPIFVKFVLAPNAHILWWIYLLAIAVGLFVLMSPWIKTKTVRYRITNYRIDFERGLLSRTIDTMELWHVDDIKLHQSLLQRILGVGQIVIVSGDEEEPRVYLDGVPNPTELFRTLEQRIISVKRQRGVVKMDMPLTPPPR